MNGCIGEEGGDGMVTDGETSRETDLADQCSQECRLATGRELEVLIVSLGRNL